ncbi:MAG: hypothetical protein WEE66_13650 [Actinomycetota bacterium]
MPSRSEQFRADIEGAYDLDAPERITLDELCRAIDVIDRLDPVADVVEIRMQQMVWSRLYGQLNLPEADGTMLAASSSRGKRAADIRWKREREARHA